MARLGSSRKAHRGYAKEGADAVIEVAEAGIHAAKNGDCTTAFDKLHISHALYGRVSAHAGSSRKPGFKVRRSVTLRQRDAAGSLIDIRDAFRRHCMVK